MAAYLWVYGFGHLRADCRGPGSAPEPYARFEYGTILPFTTSIIIIIIIINAKIKVLLLQYYHSRLFYEPILPEIALG